MQILKDTGKPLNAEEIAKRIIDGGLWESEGKTPEATVGARIYCDIKSKGDKSPFVKVGPQTFALRSSTEIESGAEPAVAAVEDTPEPPSVNADFSFTDCA